MHCSVAGRFAASLLLSLAVAFTTHAQTRDPLPRVFLDVTDLSQAAAAIAAGGAASKQVGVRVTRETASVPVPRQGPPIWLVLETPTTQASVDAWRRDLRGLLTTTRPAVVELTLAGQPAQLARFIVQAAATDAGVSGPVMLALGGDVALETVYTSATAPYVDAVVVRSIAERDAATRHIAKVDPDSAILQAAPGATAEPSRAVLDDIFRSIGSSVSAVARRVNSADVGDVLKAVASVERILAPGITEIDPKASRLRLTVGGEDVTARWPHRLLFDNATLATLLLYWGEQRPEPLAVEVAVPVEGVPVVRNVMTGERSSASDYKRDAESSLTRAQVPLTGALMLVDFNEGATEVFSDRTGVSAIRRLTAEEIIARHRQQQTRQDAAIESYIASVRLHQHFRPTVTDPGYDVVTENRYFVDRTGIEWEELSFSVNGSKWGKDRPPFPLLQPEKVLSLPLDLRFDEDYRYTLEGTGTVDGYECYLIGFEPLKTGQSLYKGTLWIDAKTFGRIRVRAVQTGLSAPVVSNEEIQVYRPVAVGSTQAFLLSHLTAHQIILIAGRNLLLEKVATFQSFDINAAHFTAERDRARRSDAVMYRETDRGLRYFVKEGDGRVVSERATTSAKAMAIGVTIDPSYDFPLPIFGINYLDFEFRNPDTQLAILFAGVLAAGNIQRPRIGNTPLDASVDFFAIAVPSNDRIYRTGGEQPSERLLTWPLTAGGNLGWQYTPFQKAAVQYQFRFDGFIKDRDTAETFVPPPSTTTHGLGLLWEYRRGGYSVVLNAAVNRRLGWRTWGDPLNPEESKATYAKYSASLSRDFVLGPFQKIHVDGAWFGGDDLDRLSRYQFGLFEATRIHGVPSSGLRFDDILLARGAYSFNVFEQYRLDLFLDQAWGRDRTFGDDRQPITGIGAAVNFRTPWWGTLLRADIGKAFLPGRYDGVGSTVVQVMLQKPLR